MTAVWVALCVLAALLGAPLFAVIFIATAVAYAAQQPALELTNAIVMMADLAEKPYLLPIPMFTFAGYLMAKSRTPKRLVHLAEAVFGWIPGGLAVVSVAVCAFFTTFTGASGVTIIALGGLLYPALRQRNYPERFSLGLMTSSGSIGLLFFPALPVFIFATVYSLSAGGGSVVEPAELFLGGLLPGILMVASLCVYSIYVGVRESIEKTPFSAAQALRALRDAWGELLLPVIILGLLQTGKVSMNEIAAITAVYVFVLEVVVYRDIHPVRDLPKVVGESMGLVGAIAVILAVIMGMNNFLTHAEIPQQILAVMKGYITDKTVFLLVLNIFLLIVGCLMDIFSATVAVLPLLIPLALDFGVDPIHLGVIFLANLEIGYLTPPVGMNLFISAFQFRRPVLQVYRSVVPFIALLIAVVGIITYVPALSLWLPGQLAPKKAAAASQSGGGTTGSATPDAELTPEQLDLINQIEQEGGEAPKSEDEEFEDLEKLLDE